MMGQLSSAAGTPFPSLSAEGTEPKQRSNVAEDSFVQASVRDNGRLGLSASSCSSLLLPSLPLLLLDHLACTTILLFECRSAARFAVVDCRTDGRVVKKLRAIV